MLWSSVVGLSISWPIGQDQTGSKGKSESCARQKTKSTRCTRQTIFSRFLPLSNRLLVHSWSCLFRTRAIEGERMFCRIQYVSSFLPLFLLLLPPSFVCVQAVALAIGKKSARPVWHFFGRIHISFICWAKNSIVLHATTINTIPEMSPEPEFLVHCFWNWQSNASSSNLNWVCCGLLNVCVSTCDSVKGKSKLINRN